ncbi:hypothetical protein COO60DRAFT_1629902 [Scenedesmus sp. NREL 46B-D3]|nr:hypothetical protein COO60DRAFT_1629902 [Scenedesmus sp. NREL 46B-D3]
MPTPTGYCWRARGIDKIAALPHCTGARHCSCMAGCPHAALSRRRRRLGRTAGPQHDARTASAGASSSSAASHTWRTRVCQRRACRAAHKRAREEYGAKHKQRMMVGDQTSAMLSASCAVHGRISTRGKSNMKSNKDPPACKGRSSSPETAVYLIYVARTFATAGTQNHEALPQPANVAQARLPPRPHIRTTNFTKNLTCDTRSPPCHDAPSSTDTPVYRTSDTHVKRSAAAGNQTHTTTTTKHMCKGQVFGTSTWQLSSGSLVCGGYAHRTQIAMLEHNSKHNSTDHDEHNTYTAQSQTLLSDRHLHTNTPSSGCCGGGSVIQAMTLKLHMMLEYQQSCCRQLRIHLHMLCWTMHVMCTLDGALCNDGQPAALLWGGHGLKLLCPTTAPKPPL